MEGQVHRHHQRHRRPHHARNNLEERDIGHESGTLEPGKYILLKYLDPQWPGFYDIFKLINDDLLIGRVYLGEYPNGVRMFTFPMTRRYGFEQMTVADHQALYAAAAVPTESLDGVWRMDMISNNNHAAAAYLEFELKPDGRLEPLPPDGPDRGSGAPELPPGPFPVERLHAVPRRDPQGVRRLPGRHVHDRGCPRPLAACLGSSSLGLFHSPANGQFGFYYTLTRDAEATFPPTRCSRPSSTCSCPTASDSLRRGDEGLVLRGRDSRLGARRRPRARLRIPATGHPRGDAPAAFDGRITVRDVNEFVDGYAHEARSREDDFGRFGDRTGSSPSTNRPAASSTSRQPGHRRGRDALPPRLPRPTAAFTFEAASTCRRTGRRAAAGIASFCRITPRSTATCTNRWRRTPARDRPGVPEVPTFEDLAAVGNLAGFLSRSRSPGRATRASSCRRACASSRSPRSSCSASTIRCRPAGRARDVRAAVLRGADTPDYFSTRSTADLQDILRDTPTLRIEKLLNTGAVRSICRTAASSAILLERLFREGHADRMGRARPRRGAGPDSMAAGSAFAGGSFWKRFDTVQNGVATGHVVNYDIAALPGLPDVRTVQYPDDNRATSARATTSCC